MNVPTNECRDRLECWLIDKFDLHLESGELLIAALTCALGAIVIFATYSGVSYAVHQFRISNTIRYLERFADPDFKKKIDDARKLDAKHGAYWRLYGLSSDHADIAYDKDRIDFVRGAKEIANYFDYVGVLMRRGHIDKILFFGQLCDVTIENWRWLRPYIYYARLWRGDRFAVKHKAMFQEAMRSLEGDPAGQTALQDLRRVFQRLEGGARTGADYQVWFEWLYLEARSWLKRPGASPVVSADADLIPGTIAAVGTGAKATVSTAKAAGHSAPT